MTHESLGTVLLLEELCNGISCVLVCAHARASMCVHVYYKRGRKGDNQTSKGQRVQEVRDELSLAGSVCARVVAELRV